MSHVSVENSGLLSLLTDRGRFGQAHLGLTTGGPVDPFAFNLANILVGNTGDATAIETTLGGVTLIAHYDGLVAITGAQSSLHIDGQPKPLWQSHPIHRGDRIALGQPQQGLRNYLAFSGGIDAETEFTSTSTVLREGIGGLGGRKLQQGDNLAVGQSASSFRCHRLPALAVPEYGASEPLKLVSGYQFHEFPVASRRRFFSSEYQITGQADRMGYRLSGPAIPSGIEGMLSEGIALGAVQVPADGQPIVLLNDRQTIGGYPKLGALLSLDCARLGQCPPGTKVHFESISIERAHNLRHLEHARVQRIVHNLEPTGE